MVGHTSVSRSARDTGLGGERELEAVFFDMDGTLLDSERVWEAAIEDLARTLGGRLLGTSRTAMVGAHTRALIDLVHDELDVDADPADSASYLLSRTAELFRTGLEWRPGAQGLLAAVHAAGIPTVLVTSTERELVEIALDTLGREFFTATVCGDEVTDPKPAPEAYLRAAALVRVDPARCVAIEDSPTGVAAAEAAGCAVLAVPSETPIGAARGRVVYESLATVGVADLRALLFD